jgi:hypothetical protein
MRFFHRDLRDIGCYIKVIDGCQQLDKETRILGLPPDFKEGVLFSTYATLVSTLHKGKVSVHLFSLCPKWSAHYAECTIGNCISICYIHAGTCQIIINQ